MQEYDRESVAKMFDEKNYNRAIRASDPIHDRASQLSIDSFELTSADILLDLGTGNGNNAMKAAKYCSHVIGMDISQKSLETARESASELALNNITFAMGSFENPSEEIDIKSQGITKILVTYSLHHLPDTMKPAALKNLADIFQGQGRLVIGDLMFFEDPLDHVTDFDKAGYDGGESDFPATVEFLLKHLDALGAKCQVQQVHPLVGVIIADFS
ncbi:MAG: class I SAM-dependent methyltransferase [Thermoplasmata archaeon]|nr:class I SAM-dependent methyltransferase [Thermoplasmata archaeon]